MRNKIRKYFILFTILLFIFSSVFIVTALEEKLSKDGINDFNIITPKTYIKNERENDEGGEGKTKQFAELKNDFKDKEEENKNTLVILGNQAKRDGSNAYEKHPVYFILAITSIFTIIIVRIIRKK